MLLFTLFATSGHKVDTEAAAFRKRPMLSKIDVFEAGETGNGSLPSVRKRMNMLRANTYPVVPKSHRKPFTVCWQYLHCINNVSSHADQSGKDLLLASTPIAASNNSRSSPPSNLTTKAS